MAQKEGKHRSILVRLGRRTLERLDLVAEEDGLSRTAVIAMLLAEALDRRDRRQIRLEERMEKMGISNTAA